MQTINLLLTSIVIAFGVPILLVVISGYTLYFSITMASYARRRNQNLYEAVALGRSLAHHDHDNHAEPPAKKAGADNNGGSRSARSPQTNSPKRVASLSPEKSPSSPKRASPGAAQKRTSPGNAHKKTSPSSGHQVKKG